MLFRTFILRRMLHEPLKSAITTLGVALGVAVVVAIQLTNASSLRGFETALNAVSGRASLEIVGSSLGIEETRLNDLGWLGEFGVVAPVIEGEVALGEPGRPTERLRVLGVDVLRDRAFRDYEIEDGSGKPEGVPDNRVAADARTSVGDDLLQRLLDPSSAILTAKFARTRGLTVGSTFVATAGDRQTTLTVRGLLKDEGPARVLDGHFVLMDIASAQLVAGRLGSIDRIEIRVEDPTQLDAGEAAIAARLPAGLSVQRPAERGKQVEQMLAAFHLNLTALSYIALVVGLFLVYNTISVAVLSRRQEIGVLRAIGVSRGRVRALFLGEAAALAAVGSTIGVGVGRLLADAAVALTSTTVSSFWIATAAAPPDLNWRVVALAFGIGVPLSLIAAAVPAEEATRVSPMIVIRDTDRAERRAHLPVHTALTSVALLLVGGFLATRAPVNGLPIFGYASAFAVVFGAALLVPGILFGTALVLRRLARRTRSVAGAEATGKAEALPYGAVAADNGRSEDRPLRSSGGRVGIEYWLAINNVSAGVSRLSISVAALAVSLSMMVAIAVMVGSFRSTLIYWVSQTLKADLFVSPGSTGRPTANATLSDDVVRVVQGSADVLAVDRFGVTEVPYDGTQIRVGAGEFDVILNHGSLLFKAPADGRAAMRRAIGEDAVVASEAFTIRHHAAVGDRVSVPTPAGPVPFRVAAVYYDYSNDRGVLMMDRPVFEKHFGPQASSGLTVYLREGVNPDEARARLLGAIGHRHAVFINTNQQLRTEVLRIFDSTFAITYALELVAIVVAMLGISGTLVTLVLERERDFAILRVVGASRRQIRRVVVGEAMLIGAVSQAIGIVVGLALSVILIYVIDVQSFGWTIQFHLPWAFLTQSTVLILLATGLAGLYPARRAVRLSLKRDG